MERAYAFVDLGYSQIENLCRGYFGNIGHLEAYEPLSGGAVNTTYLILWQDRKYILRLYVRDPQLAQIEKDIYHLIHKKVPMPDLLHVGSAVEGYSFAIFAFIAKKHLFEISDRSSAQAISSVLGKTLANIHNFHFSKAGLLGSGFAIHTPFGEGSSPYFAYAMEHLSRSSLAWSRLGDERAVHLRDFLDKSQDFFPKIHQGGVLVHSDFKPVNLLWDAESGLTVLDWEFAHIGHPLLDFAILLRHFRDFPFSIESLEKGYTENGGKLPDDWIRKARITDIINVVQLLTVPIERPHLFRSLLQSIELILSDWTILDEKIRNDSRNME